MVISISFLPLSFLNPLPTSLGHSPQLPLTFSCTITSLRRTTHILPFKTLPVLNREATSFLFPPLTSLPLTHCHLLHSSFHLHLFTYRWSLSSHFTCLWFPHIIQSSSVTTPIVFHVLLYITDLERLQMPAIQNSNTITSPNRTWNQAWFCWLTD
jgi:hypothetical protein